MVIDPTSMYREREEIILRKCSTSTTAVAVLRIYRHSSSDRTRLILFACVCAVVLSILDAPLLLLSGTDAPTGVGHTQKELNTCFFLHFPLFTAVVQQQ